ncbi:hypothetical protein CVIRNUC_004834 [Coccomyxa viridis]|uniref:Calcineurin-like phosphoesterase domain-containing protein n=1 Tax=Coccomyxa viridis TaxID=1274662 RepID=A0AAV1I496_9CHLO|nr:hypothetical protein CVIRNUC_004834 [Coccomyxa viridis]
MRNVFRELHSGQSPKVAERVRHSIDYKLLACKAFAVWREARRCLSKIYMVSECHARTSDHNGAAVRLAIIGDVHGDWDSSEDGQALQALNCDAAVFVGDFNEEDIPLVHEIAAVNSPPKAVVLGNHDAWTCLTNWSIKKFKDRLPSGDSSIYSEVEEQLQILGADHVGYTHKHFKAADGTQFAIVGGRPFSKGGHRWTDCEDFYMRFYKVPDMETSAMRIAETVLNLPEGVVPILAAHNGPTNLGNSAWSISGVDFKPGGGDHGDWDLELALQHVHAAGRKVPMVVFGHMHERLKGTSVLRDMVAVDASTGTVYLNAAVVPRVRQIEVNGQPALARHFCIAELCHGHVQHLSNVWMSRGEDGSFTANKQLLLERASSSQGHGQVQWYRIWRGHTREHEVIHLL